MKKWVCLMACISLFICCNNSARSDGKTGKTYSDTLLDEVMEDHNVGMAKMSKITEAQKRVQLAIDSIAKLPASLQKNASGYKLQLDSTLSKLQHADSAMNKWMEDFDLDSAKDNEEKRIEYLKSEKVKISRVKEAMISSLTSADSLLKK